MVYSSFSWKYGRHDPNMQGTCLKIIYLYKELEICGKHDIFVAWTVLYGRKCQQRWNQIQISSSRLLYKLLDIQTYPLEQEFRDNNNKISSYSKFTDFEDKEKLISCIISGAKFIQLNS